MNHAYEDYRNKQIESALLYQDFVVDTMLNMLGFAVVVYSSKAYQQGVGESRTGVEIKNDKKYASTGNVYIEIAEKARPRPGAYAMSGIYRNDNTWLYVIGDYDTIFIFSKRTLLLLHKSGRYKTITNGTATSEAFLLPDKDARAYAAAVLEPNKGKVVSSLVSDLNQVAAELHRLSREDKKQGTLFGDMVWRP